MTLFKYFKRVKEDNCDTGLPNLDGPLAKTV